MDDINVFFSKCNPFNNLPDELTKEAVRSFAIDRIKYQKLQHCVYTICRRYPPVSINKLSYKELLSTEDTWNSIPGRKPFVLFLVYAIDHGYLRDERISRLKDFDIDSLCKKGSYIPYILKDNNYNRLLNSSLYKHNNNRLLLPVYTFEITPSTISDANLCQSINKYLNYVKYDSDLIPNVRYLFLVALSDLCADFLRSPHLVIPDRILPYFQNNSKEGHSRIVRTQQVILAVLSQLCDDGIVLNENIKTLSAIRKGKEWIDRDTVIRILQSKHLDRWCSFPYKGTNGKMFTSVRYINIESSEIRSIVCDFLNQYNENTSISVSIFCDTLSDSFGKYKVMSVEDLGFMTYIEQINYYKNDLQCSKSLIRLVTAFYLYIQQTIKDDIFSRDSVPNSLLYRPSIGVDIASGYRVYVYNQVEPVPNNDKWLLCYKKYDRDTTTNFSIINYERIECQVYRNICKNYIWKADTQIISKIKFARDIYTTLNYLYEIKTGKVLSIYSPSPDINHITVNDAAAVKNYIIATFDNNRTRNGHIYRFRALLKHAEYNELPITVDSGVYYILTNTLDNNYDNVNPIPNDQLGKIAQLLKSKARESTIASLYSSIFYIALETEFRGSQIVSLKRDCLRETSKKGEYVLVSETKTSAGELVEQPVSTYIVRELREVMLNSEVFRKDCTDINLLNLIFISPSKKKGTYKQISEHQFNSFFKACCEELSLPRYTLQNLRDTHMTKAEEFKIRNQLTDMEQRVLTGHRSAEVDDKHYVKLSIQEMLEAVHGVIIGDVHLDGKVHRKLDPSIANSENEVSNGCGYCKSPSCGILSTLDCLVCKDFVTMISRLPYFEERIALLDKKIEAASVPHDKEDYINIKRLLLRYVEEILKVEEDTENGRN